MIMRCTCCRRFTVMITAMLVMETFVFLKLFSEEKRTLNRLSKFEFIYETANAFPTSLELIYDAPSGKLNINKKLPYTLTFPKWHQDVMRLFLSWFRIRFQVLAWETKRQYAFTCIFICFNCTLTFVSVIWMYQTIIPIEGSSVTFVAKAQASFLEKNRASHVCRCITFATICLTR